MNADWSLPIVDRRSGGSVALELARARAMTRSTTSTVLAPDCLRVATPIGVTPSSRGDFAPPDLSTTRPISPNVMTDRPGRRATIAIEVADVLDPAHRPQRDLGGPVDEAAAGNLDVLPLHRASGPDRR